MTEHGYGGFWIRFLALLVDSVIVSTMGVLLVAAGIFLGPILGPTWLLILPVLLVIGPLLYWVGMQASARQATYGKALLGLSVTTAEGGRMSLLHSLAREMAKILSSIPLMLGYVIAGVTGRKQALHDLVASTTVVRQSPGHVVVGLAVGLFGWIAPAGLVFVAGVGMFGALLGAVRGGVLEGALGKVRGEQTAQSLRGLEETPVTPPAANASTPNASRSAGGQEAILAARLAGMDDQAGTTQAGPVLLKLDNLFGGSFWIKVHLPPVTEFHGSNPVVRVTSVTDSKGIELYDPNGQLESEFFQKVSMSPWDSPVPHLAGTRSVSLKTGARASDAQRVEGKVTLTLPVNLGTARFAAADVGKQQTVHGRTLTLQSFSEKEAQVRFGGDDRPLVAVTGYGLDGKEVVTGMRPGSAGAPKITFRSPAVRFEAVIAESTVAREFPFVLTRNSVAAAVASGPRTEPAPAVKPSVPAEANAPAPTMATVRAEVQPRVSQTPPPDGKPAAPIAVASAEISGRPRPQQQGMVRELAAEAMAALDHLSPRYATEATLIQGWFRDRTVLYYDFGTVPRGVAAARVLWPIHGFDARANPVAIRGQRPIFTTIPRLGDYSGLWQLTYVVTADMAQPNELRDAAAVDAAVREKKAALRDANLVLNLPIVPRGTTLARDTTRGMLGWYEGQDVQFFDFGQASLTPAPMWRFAAGRDGSGDAVLVEGQFGILDSIPVAPTYPDLWDIRYVHVDNAYVVNSMKSAAAVRNAGLVVDSATVVRNLPVAIVDGIAAPRVPSPLRAFADLRSPFPPRPTRSP